MSLFGDFGTSPNPGLWRQITGIEAAASAEKHAENSRLEQGPWNGQLLRVQQQRERVDVLLASNSQGPELPDAGNLFEVAPGFFRMAEAALSVAVTRVAVGAVVHMEADSLEASMKVLQPFIPHVGMLQDSSDFVYQINLPKRCASDSSVRINRLSKWSAVSFQFISVAGGTPATWNSQGALLELDINTAAETPLGKESPVPAILREMWELGAVVAAEGVRQ